MTTLQETVAQECRRLADFLATLSAAQWEAQSLCEKWRTREVIAHLTMPARYTPERFGAEITASGGDFTTMSDRVAARDGSLPIATLQADLRSTAMQEFAPPGGGPAGALSHVVIHGLDITAALDADCAASAFAVHTVLDHLVQDSTERFGHDLSGIRLMATDLDWSSGVGREFAAPAGQLILYVANRRVPGLA